MFEKTTFDYTCLPLRGNTSLRKHMLLFFCFNISFILPLFFFPLSRSSPLLLPSHPSSRSGGCLFPNTFQPAYLLGLYCCNVVFSNPICYCAFHPLDITPPSVLGIRVCVICIVACNSYPEISIVGDRQCGTRPGCLFVCGKPACVGSVPETVLVCVIALCTAISNEDNALLSR